MQESSSDQMQLNMGREDQDAFIPASVSLPEITVKAVILSIILTVALAAANAYLGLKVGTTVSASIPAAVISMGILRFFRRSNILENNIVQTAASSGEALVAGIAYIVPALLVLHIWSGFNYWETVLIAITGGILGVLFSVPLRRVLLAEKSLRFPEGTAIGNVLKASASGARTVKHLFVGGLVGAVISFAQNGLEVFSGSLQLWTRIGNSVVGFGSGFDPALLAAGYIVGPTVAVSIFTGVFIGWIIGIPYISHTESAATLGADPTAAAMAIWHSHLRFIGVGMMLIGGLWTLITFLKPMIKGIHASVVSLQSLRKGEVTSVLRTEKDIPINYIMWMLILSCIPLALIFWNFTSPTALPITQLLRFVTIVVCVVFSLVGGFVFSSICGYFTGLVGSTNNPLSGMTLSALIIISVLLVALLDPSLHFKHALSTALNASSLAIIVGAVVAAAAAISNDTIQDLKAGQMIGATPWKQQVMLIIGVTVAALVIPAILNLLFNAYGIGGVFPHPGMDPKQMLSAPQANLMATLVQGIFGHNLPWNLIYIGFVIAIICIIIDSYARRRNTRFPVLAVALGIYLPLEASVPLFIGGMLCWLVERNHLTTEDKQRGLILACGLVAGAAIMGVLLAIPFAIAQSSDALKIVSDKFIPIANILGLLVTVLLLSWMYRVIVKKKLS